MATQQDRFALNRKINNRHYIFSVGGDLIDWHIELTGWWQHRSDGSSGIIPTTFTYKLQSNGENIKGSMNVFLVPVLAEHILAVFLKI